MSTLTTRAVAGLGVVALGLVAVPAAGAQSENTAKLSKAGSTSLKLSSSASKALKRLGVKATPVSGAKVKSGQVVFKITGGSLDPKLQDGASISHSGGLRFSKGSRKLTLTNFRIRITGASATISARAGGASATVFTLNLKKAKITGRNPITRWKASGISVRLSSKGAAALNKTFRTKAFKKGATIGTATVDARLAELIVSGGETNVTLDAGTLGLLAGAGVVPGVVAPTQLQGTVVNFPIQKSKVRANLSSGTIKHTGGLTLTKGATTIKAANFDINLATGRLAASINDAASKTDLLNLDVTNVSQSGAQPLRVRGVRLTLNDTAAAAVGGLAGAPVPAGTTFGTAELVMNIR